tara:strand:+ start:182 stop:1027 length:846 start_codon:yes stop_codon:yes gene_type:complete
VPAPRPRPISDFLPRFQNVAQSSQYLVKFALPSNQSSGGLRSFLRRKGVNDRFVVEDAGLLCSGALLPGSALASIDTRGDFQGVVERFAHTRNFTQIQLEFYVDNEYKSMKFIEHWMEYITGANTNLASDAYHFQLNYPETYKSNETKIIKFERDYNRFLEYRFIGLFPLALNSTRVSYQGSQVLKASASFSYDRYICGESSSLARDLKRAFNEIFNLGNPVRDGGSVSDNQNLINQNAYGIITRSGLDTKNSEANGKYGGTDTSQNSSVRPSSVITQYER